MLPPTDLSRPALKAAGTGDHSRKQRRRALCVAAQSHLNHRCVGCGRSVSLRGRDTAARIGASGTATVGAELDHWVGGGREAEMAAREAVWMGPRAGNGQQPCAGDRPPAGCRSVQPARQRASASARGRPLCSCRGALGAPFCTHWAVEWTHSGGACGPDPRRLRGASALAAA